MLKYKPYNIPREIKLPFDQPPEIRDIPIVEKSPGPQTINAVRLLDIFRFEQDDERMYLVQLNRDLIDK